MAVKYYQVRKTEHPNGNGIVVKFEEGRLETFAGGYEPREYGCKDNLESFSVDNGYQFEEISEKKAKELRTDYEDWTGMQALTYHSAHLNNTAVGRNRPTGF